MATFTVTESATVNAPIARVFALSTRIELVRETLGMNPITQTGTLTSGHITLGSRVHWQGWKFLLPVAHHTLITGFAESHIEDNGLTTAWFQDSQEQGHFAFFQHDHHFRETLDPVTQQPITHLHDVVQFTLPFGPLGSIVAILLLAPHVRKLCRKRFARIKALAEGNGWLDYVDPTQL
jgi:ligand-binding SRPBCC domain-containing protein